MTAPRRTTVGPVDGRHAFLDHDGVIAFAHRGGASDWPENTLSAFQHAVDLGYRYIETDVHASADGELFAFHDDHLGRVSDTDCYISDLTAAALDQVRVEETERVPRLDEILRTWPYLRINIDPKDDGSVVPLAQTIQRHSAIDRVCIGSFSDRRIAYCREVLGPDLCTSMGPREAARLRGASLGLPIETGLSAACAQLPTGSNGRTIIDQRLVETAHRLGIQVHVWTIDDPAEMEDLLDLGVDGVMTDRPVVLRDVLVERGQWKDYLLD